MDGARAPAAAGDPVMETILGVMRFTFVRSLAA